MQLPRRSAMRTVQQKRRGLLAGVFLLLVASLAIIVPQLLPEDEQVVTIMGVGDIAEAGSTLTNAMATGDLIREANPDAVFTTGDNAYPDGSASDFADKYDPTWGSFKAKTHPTPGNHEYHSNPPTGYLNYFGAANVTNSSDGGVYYAWDAGVGWRAYAVNTSISTSGAQLTWLKNDLAANPAAHYIIYAHSPRYTSGSVHSPSTSVCPLWNALAATGRLEISMAGHEHSYERFAKMDCAGNLSDSGVTSFVLGSGGNQLYELASPEPGSAFRNDTDYGVLKLDLRETSFDWQFIASGRGWNGSTSIDTGNKGEVLDSGSRATNGAATPTPTPTTSPTTSPTLTPTPTPTTALHFVSNEEGAFATTSGLGFNIHDTGMSASTINALPAGTRAMVWASNGKCPSALSSTFTDFVASQKDNPKVYGYYLVDEPDDPSATCVAGIRQMADYIHANAPGQQAFIVLTDYPGTYAAYAPANSHADLIGLDPYPCQKDTGCRFDTIGQEVDTAMAAGIPRSSIVPVFQTFAGEPTWSAPTADDLSRILSEWSEHVPSPVMDYAYSWGCQGGALTDCLSRNNGWQAVMAAYNVSGSTPPPPSTGSVQRAVSASSDDAEESASGSMSTSSSDLELVYDGSNQSVGLRFTGLTIPNGATINRAYVEFRTDETGSGATTLDIRGEAADNPVTFSSTNKISARQRTVASVPWVAVPWTAVDESGLGQRSPDLSPVIQEIVDRRGWTTGNALALIITGTGERTARAYDHSPAGAPVLTVEYGSVVPPANKAPVVNAGPDRQVGLSSTTRLDATVTDDGLPFGTLTTHWSQSSGPGTVIFQDATSVDTDITLPTAGTYIFQLTATDGTLTASDTVQVTAATAPSSGTIERRVSTGSDDAEESASGSMYTSSSDLELVYDGNNQTVGLRFTSLGIPTGATITRAYVQFRADEKQSETTSLVIRGQAADNPVTFSSRNKISTRPRTSTSVAWSPPPWVMVSEAGPDQQSPDVSPVVQQIVDRSGWSSGNALVLIITGTGHRTARAYNYSSSAAPLLHVEYRLG